MLTEVEKRIKSFDTIIAKLEKRRKSKIFLLVQHDHDHLCLPISRKILSSKKEFNNIETLEILIHSTGGHIDIAYQAAKFFRRHCKRLNVIVPWMAKSAATLLCLNADNIYMGEFAELGPLDVQIQDPFEKGQFFFSPLDEFKSMEFLREYASEVVAYFSELLVDLSGMSVKEAVHESLPAVTGMMAPLYARIDPSRVGGYRRSLAVGEEYAKRLLRQRRFADPEELTQKLIWSYPAHDFVIDYDEAEELGLPVKKLEGSQEDALMNALRGILNYGVSRYGFIEPSKPKPAKARTTKKKATPRKRPVPVPTSVAAKSASAA